MEMVAILAADTVWASLNDWPQGIDGEGLIERFNRRIQRRPLLRRDPVLISIAHW